MEEKNISTMQTLPPTLPLIPTIPSAPPPIKRRISLRRTSFSEHETENIDGNKSGTKSEFESEFEDELESELEGESKSELKSKSCRVINNQILRFPIRKKSISDLNIKPKISSRELYNKRLKQDLDLIEKNPDEKIDFDMYLPYRDSDKKIHWKLITDEEAKLSVFDFKSQKLPINLKCRTFMQNKFPDHILFWIPECNRPPKYSDLIYVGKNHESMNHFCCSYEIQQFIFSYEKVVSYRRYNFGVDSYDSTLKKIYESTPISYYELFSDDYYDFIMECNLLKLCSLDKFIYIKYPIERALYEIFNRKWPSIAKT